MKKGTKKKVKGALWTLGAFVVGKILWHVADGERRVDEAANQLKGN